MSSRDAGRLAAFRRRVLAYARRPRPFPWRETTDPYAITVSEIMLQQTQVQRVAEKYPAFLQEFPDVQTLARAPLAAVLRAWSGLGYNRRALALHRLAQVVVAEHGGRMPRTVAELDALPGIGAATAAAICAYAYNQPVTYLETNIRAVFIHEFFPRRRAVSDAKLLPLVAQALDRRHPRRWYNALMDYGTRLKRDHANPARRSAHHTRQSAFAGSDRQVRGLVLRRLLTGAQTAAGLRRTAGVDAARLRIILEGMLREGLLRRKNNCYTVA